MFPSPTWFLDQKRLLKNVPFVLLQRSKQTCWKKVIIVGQPLQDKHVFFLQGKELQRPTLIQGETSPSACS